jgi:hypothetical protein
MRKELKASVVMVIAAAAMGGSAAASGASKSVPRGRAVKARSTVLKMYTSLRQAALLDFAQPGFSLGDQDVFSDDVLRKKNGAKVGVDGGVCTVVRVTNATARSGLDQCLITFSLRGGQITTQVLQPSGQATGTATGVITGGTGSYRNAHGIYVVSFLSAAAANVTFSFAQ